MVSRAEQQLMDNIEQFGFSVMHVPETIAGAHHEPGYSFSIGLYKKFQLPEIMIVGLDQELCQTLIENISVDYEEGRALKVGEFNADIVENFDCLVVPLDLPNYIAYLSWARWFYKGNDFQVVQIVYPDLLGLFPWDKDFSKKILQPVLSKKYEKGLAAG
jgi:hypothetical protein